MRRIKIPAMVAIALLAVGACRSSSISVTPKRAVESATQVPPTAVVKSAAIVDAAARSGRPSDVAPLGSTGFEFDLKRPDISFEQALESSPDGAILEQLHVILASVPAKRLSPFGNGAMQELWIFPAFAVTEPDNWSEMDVSDAIDHGLFTASEVAEYKRLGAYAGYSAGFRPDGEWVFFVSSRVARTPP